MELKTKNMNEKKPIGFYLKKVDELLSNGIDAVQSEFGISRFEWQILNVLKTNPSGHDEIAKELDIPRRDVVFALDAISDPISLYEPIYTDNGESICVMDQVGDTKNTDEQWLEHLALSNAISDLNEREKKILSLRFYAGKTQMEVAGEIGISQAQVSRLEKNALGKIRKNIFPS